MTKRFLTLMSVCVLVLSLTACGSFTINLNGQAQSNDRSLNDWYERLDEVRQIIKEDYYVEVDDETLMQGAIDGMLASLGDPYSFYYTPEEMAADLESVEGKYVGIGVLVTSDENGGLKAVRVYKDGPAFLAGIRPGDVFVSADGNPVSAATTEDMNAAVSLIKGVEGTTVKLEVLRGEENLTFDVVRGSVETEQVSYQMLEDGIGYIEIAEFMGNAASGYLEAIDYMKANNAKGLIVDVRNNPGGMLGEVLKISDAMLPEGVIVSMVNRKGDKVEYTSNAEYYDIPLVVLVNGSSASASEVFSGAIQDYGLGTLVGTNTFGKGIVQATYNFDEDKAGMQITIETYYTPNGRALHGVGIEPDVVIEQAEDYKYEYKVNLETDVQLRKALEILLEEIGENAA